MIKIKHYIKKFSLLRKNKILIFCFKIIIFVLFMTIFYNINLNNNKIPIKLEFTSKNEIFNLLYHIKNDSLSEKENFFKIISKNNGKNITKIKAILLNGKARFGNMLIIVYRALFFCKMIGCKKIILNKKNSLFIEKKIIAYKIKIAIDIYDKNMNNSELLISYPHFFYNYNNKLINPNYYINFFRKEILSNLPNIIINKKDFYIYMRSGDIFKRRPSPSGRRRAPPPLCFFSKILNYVNFNEVFIICEDTKNPVIKELLNLYSHIKYQKRDLKTDISYLVNAYNIAGGGFSTFFDGILLMNKNIENLWIFKYQEEPLRKKYNIENLFKSNNDIMPYIMYSSNDFIKKMNPWINSKVQRDLLIKHKCLNHFILNNEAIIY